MGFKFPEQDSSSIQSTSQSCPEIASVEESSPYRQNIMSMQSGYNATHGNSEGAQLLLPPSQVEYRPSFACFPLSYAEPYYSSLLAAYGPQAMVQHPQMVSMTSARVPLPLDLPQGEPIYVNAKQYHAILRRRQYRAKLEAQNKLISKTRQPYLHESRHLHALNRPRGSGGRFLNKRKQQESNATSPTNGWKL